MTHEQTQPRMGCRPAPRQRRGIVVVLTGFLLVVLFGFLALSVDTGRMVLTETEMQNAVDAAALAASQEINAAIAAAAEEQGSANIDANSIAIQAARQMAAQVALANGVHVDADNDVYFGKRVFDEASEQWSISWGDSPYNVVKVIARRDNPDKNPQDGELPLAFGWAVGKESVPLVTSATAFVEARDLVLVLDFSGSMNDDSDLTAIEDFGQVAVEDNLRDIYEALEAPSCHSLPFEPEYLRVEGNAPTKGCKPQAYVTFKGDEVIVESSKDLSNVVLEFDNGVHQKFDSLSGYTGTFAGTGSNSGKQIKGCWVKSGCNPSGDGPGYGERFRDTNAEVKKAFGLLNCPYPYQSGSWNEFIDYCRNDNAIDDAGYRQMYGTLNWTHYLLREEPKKHQTADLWKTPHYPFHAMKNGTSLFLQFLDELNFGDQVGLVTYDSESRVESLLDDGDAYVSLGDDLITPIFVDIDTIQRHKQAGHYDVWTGLGYGIEDARQLLADATRYGSRKTMLIMTDGQANRAPAGWTPPADFDWAAWTDYDGSGDADYTSNDAAKQYAFWQATEAVKEGVTLHTLAVGAGADRDLMQAIAYAGGGIHINVPGGTTIEEMESQLEEAFLQIAAKVPAAKLTYEQLTGQSGN